MFAEKKEASKIRYSRLAENFLTKERCFKYLISSCAHNALVSCIYTGAICKKDIYRIFIIPRLSEIVMEKKSRTSLSLILLYPYRRAPSFPSCLSVRVLRFFLEPSGVIIRYSPRVPRPPNGVCV